MLLCSCNDSIFSDNDNTEDSNTVRFYVTSGVVPGAETRAQSFAVDDTVNLLQPLLLKSPELEKPLYLHTYVAEENERSTGVSPLTRGCPVNNVDSFLSVVGPSGFGVAAYYSDNEKFISPYAVAKPVDGLSNIWGTSPVCFWPGKDYTIRFSAYAPSSASSLLQSLSLEGEKMSFDYVAPHSSDNSKDAEAQPDVMFATALYDKKPDDGIATLNFRHALSAIKFAVRDVVNGTIEKITISGVKGSGHCEFSPSESGVNVFTWSGQKDTCSYSQTFGFKTEDKYPNVNESNDVVINESMPSKTFMLIPQELTDDAVISIVFNRKDGQKFILSGKIKDNSVNKWEPGKEYIYTISTSSSNWTYHFEVVGCNQEVNDDEPTKGKFSDCKDGIYVNQTVTTGAYYKVKSYRERANNPNYKEAVAWHAVTSKGTTEAPDELKDLMKDYEDSIIISPSTWMPYNQNMGDGSADGTFKKYDVSFYPQMVGTDHKGDWDLRKKSEIGSVDNPKDLSMVYGPMNTANCYVINASGYFKFPVVYGNAITDGKPNSSSYTYSGTNTINKYPPLKKFTDYKGKEISGPKISGAKDAILVWSDAYNIIGDVRLVSGGNYDYVHFKVNKLDLQQGNVVLAVRDSEGKIMWSWHIWVNENWLYNNMRLGNGDVDFDAWDSGDSFKVAPYNLGWCDPKNLWYLKRIGTMKFIQEETGQEVTLNVEQREKWVEYWIGNNTYYQFGRKDPIVGFMNSSSVVKYNFGGMPYEKKKQPVRLQDGIMNPNALYVGASEVEDNNDWLSEHYYNLWNNTKITGIETPSMTPTEKIDVYFYGGIKTVYDPSPAGYMVPPVGFFRIITKGNVNTKDYLDFNGDTTGIQGHKGYNEYKAYSKKDKKGKYISLTGTGHRWYGNKTMVAGANFNPGIVYLWSSQVNFGSADYRVFDAYGLALGFDITKGNYVSDYRFPGRRAMARPVRPVKIK